MGNQQAHAAYLAMHLPIKGKQSTSISTCYPRRTRENETIESGNSIVDDWRATHSLLYLFSLFLLFYSIHGVSTYRGAYHYRDCTPTVSIVPHRHLANFSFSVVLIYTVRPLRKNIEVVANSAASEYYVVYNLQLRFVMHFENIWKMNILNPDAFRADTL